MLSAWFANVGKRLAKSPKVFLADTGLAAHLRGADALRLRRDRHEFGLLLENFVVMELKKQRGWSRMQPELFHFRTSEGHQVDVVLEDRAGGIVGIEIKAAVTVDARDFTGLRVLAEAAGNRFRRGILLYTGAEMVPFGANLHAVPVSAVWSY